MITAALAGVAIATPVVAHADAGDGSGYNAYAFVNDMRVAGLYGDPATEIAAGEAVCSRIAAGETQFAIAWDLHNRWNTSGTDTGRFVGISVRDLCPQYLPPGTRL
jgi:hypothetical protein